MIRGGFYFFPLTIMATRSFISRATDDGFEGVYCHWDGYLDGVGRLLLEHYSDPDKLARLLSFGDISSLDAEVGWEHDFDDRDDGCTTYYGRDRGESGDHIQTKRYKSMDAMLQAADQMGCEYIYLFSGLTWSYAYRGPTVLRHE